MLKKWIYLACAAAPCLTCQAADNTPSAPAAKPANVPETQTHLGQYLKMIHEHDVTFGPLGSWQKGEIEIIVNPEQIKRIENQTRLRLISKGVSEKTAENWSAVGIVAEDNYWMWIRDAVVFPSGVYGTYDRLMWKSGMDGAPGVAVLAILANKKIVVNLAYRHATRSWEIELPRGKKQQGETLEQTALRELKEETGYQLTKTELLGSCAPNSGVLMSVVPLFFGIASHSGETQKEFSEAIFQNPAFSKQELKDGFVKGYIEVPIKGQIVRVNCRDPFLTYAIVLAEGKGII